MVLIPSTNFWLLWSSGGWGTWVLYQARTTIALTRNMRQHASWKCNRCFMCALTFALSGAPRKAQPKDAPLVGASALERVVRAHSSHAWRVLRTDVPAAQGYLGKTMEPCQLLPNEQLVRWILHLRVLLLRRS